MVPLVPMLLAMSAALLSDATAVPLRPIAVLYVRRDSIYKRLQGVDAWDEDRDAMKYDGPDPVIVHPPCGPWGAFAWKSKQDPATGLRAVDQVRAFGGVLEQPANSKLFKAKDVPAPGEPADAWGGYSIAVQQGDFGHRAPKKTWLYIVGVPKDGLPPLPPDAGDPGGRIEFMGEAEREKTPPAFADWLLEVARRASQPAQPLQPAGA